MLAESVMTKDLITAHIGEPVGDVLQRMRKYKLRMLPVLNDKKIAVGVVSTFSILEKIVPSYIASGDLEQVAFAPDIGFLKSHYDQSTYKKIEEVMDDAPLLVKHDESLLSTAAVLTSLDKHEYALVIDDDGSLVGIISSGDILDYLRIMKVSDKNDA